MNKKRVNPLVKIFFAAALCIVITVIVILVMGYRYMTFTEGKFLGKIKNNVPFEGKITYQNGTKVTLEEGYRLIYGNGDIYEGELKNIVRDGKGKMYFKNSGGVYEGTFSKNELTGSGIYTYKNGDIYEGDFVNGKKDGEGVLIIKGSQIFTGSFKDDMFNGYGVIEFLKSEDEDLSRDEPEVTEPEPTETYNFGDPTETEFEEPEYEPLFTPYEKDNETVIGKYEGFFKDGAQSGKGVQYYSNGDCYDGEYLYGRKSGRGKYTWSTGETYEGSFYDDLFDTRQTDENGMLVTDTKGEYVHGDKAVYTRRDGSIFTGFFEAGKQVTPDEKIDN